MVDGHAFQLGYKPRLYANMSRNTYDPNSKIIKEGIITIHLGRVFTLTLCALFRGSLSLMVALRSAAARAAGSRVG